MAVLHLCGCNGASTQWQKVQRAVGLLIESGVTIHNEKGNASTFFRFNNKLTKLKSFHHLNKVKRVKSGMQENHHQFFKDVKLLGMEKKAFVPLCPGTERPE